jgi:murein DD-endopeptidase MepM/ murein hydrolase activator NlpD
MQKNVRFFTFQFSYSTKNTIKIRRIRISKRLVQSGSVAIFLTTFISIFGVGLHGLIRNRTFARNLDPGSVSNQLAAAQLEQAPVQQAKLDYSRPDVAEAVAVNSGGPVDTDDTTIADPLVESELKDIVASSASENIPNMWAHAGKINNEFGFRRNPFGGRTYEFHPGMDIDGERGDLVVAPANGTVTRAGWQGGYGQMIEIDHGNGLITRYGHLSKLNVEIGDAITRGQLIGFIGSTGRSTGPHLHYELRLNDHPINPRRFLPPEPTDLVKPE